MHRVGQFILFAALCGPASAQSTRPVEAPAGSTPRDAVRALNFAMRAGDVNTLKHLFLATTRPSRA